MPDGGLNRRLRPRTVVVIVVVVLALTGLGLVIPGLSDAYRAIGFLLIALAVVVGLVQLIRRTGR
jgi:cytochrome b subunit of formate dehydrogenase